MPNAIKNKGIKYFIAPPTYPSSIGLLERIV